MNTSSFNQSNELPFPGPSPTVMILHNTIIILVTIMGNLLLIGAVFRSNRVKRRKRVTPVQVLMLHLTTADILFALLTIFPNLVTIITHYEFHGPDSLCRFVKFLQYSFYVVPLYSSAFLLVAISADRYYAICRPLDSIKMGVYNRPSLYALISWSLALLLSTPQLFLFYKDDQTKECTAFYAEPWMYTVYVCIFNTVVWLLPSALAGIFYTCVCRAVWHSLAIRNTRPRESDVLMSNRTNSPGHIRTCELDRRRIQTVKLTLTIVATNFLLWAPFCLIQVVDALAPAAINPVVATYILLFGNLNSCVNPWMWFIFNRDLMRRANPFYRLPSTKASRTEFTLTERPQSRND
ncbi:ntr-1 [Pristionchus pacificus]|uniref:Ntr-1 n=1 Tax=Pristionchus pacificus TaxID=54126 RepID=A0A2A6CCL2_PRIPA|nr:ntr-1 [Pristionchus pacificus]|eukprot:PDM75942.1 ntr-1 [Pristionchus pacificus]